jgi:hypothetical protein
MVRCNLSSTKPHGGRLVLHHVSVVQLGGSRQLLWFVCVNEDQYHFDVPMFSGYKIAVIVLPWLRNYNVTQASKYKNTAGKRRLAASG